MSEPKVSDSLSHNPGKSKGLKLKHVVLAIVCGAGIGIGAGVLIDKTRNVNAPLVQNSENVRSETVRQPDTGERFDPITDFAAEEQRAAQSPVLGVALPVNSETATIAAYTREVRKTAQDKSASVPEYLVGMNSDRALKTIKAKYHVFYTGDRTSMVEAIAEYPALYQQMINEEISVRNTAVKEDNSRASAREPGEKRRKEEESSGQGNGRKIQIHK